MLTFRQSRRHWHMTLLSSIARHRAQSVADSSSRKVREKDATDSSKKRLGCPDHKSFIKFREAIELLVSMVEMAYGLPYKYEDSTSAH
jgi:hypothetical protein